MDRYDPEQIESKWQRVWADERTWEVSNEPDERAKCYVLEMLPYPSGEPHIGHLKIYAVGDAVAHFRRRNGFRVLHPMGYDAFGLPAENHAIKTGQHPRESTETSIEEFRRQLRRWGVSIDWSREFATHEPSYYRWTQWLFLRMFERGLAYRSEAAVNWCPKDATVLSNEQVIDGRCERCGTVVEARNLEQWFFRITDYADRLLEDMASIEWPSNVVAMQRNWIGRSEGAEVTFVSDELGTDYPVFTTRPDTLFGATFFVMAPEHPDVLRLSDSPEVAEYVRRALTESAEDRGAEDRAKTGVALGTTVTNPVNGEHIPVYVADYVLMEYGTGAIMAVPAHDARDFAFAEKHGLEVRRVIDGGELPHAGDGPMVNSGRFDGLHNREGSEKIVEWLGSEDLGRPTVNYRLRDWLLSVSATGAVRSRSCTASTAASCRSPTTSCRSSCPRSRTTRRRGARPWPPPRTGCAPNARGAAARPGARPTRWTPSWTPPGTSCATATHATTRRRGIARHCAHGCRWTSTSAVWSTRSCI